MSAKGMRKWGHSGACYPRKIWKFKYCRMQSGAIWMLKFSKQQHFIVVNKVKKLNDLFLARQKNLSNILSLLRTETERSLTAGTTRSNFTRLKLLRNNQQLHWGFFSDTPLHRSIQGLSQYTYQAALWEFVTVAAINFCPGHANIYYPVLKSRCLG